MELSQAPCLERHGQSLRAVSEASERGQIIMRSKNMIPIVCFVGPSGIGKTTVLEQVAANLKRRGFKVAAVKHTSHGFDIDKPGKDSWRLAKAGCDIVVLTSHNRMALIQERSDEPSLEEIVTIVEKYVDILLVEGYKDSSEAKIEVFRSSMCNALLSDPEQIIAVVTDLKMPLNVPQFGFTEVDSIADVIIRQAASSKAGISKGESEVLPRKS